jgi:hypothetical protein
MARRSSRRRLLALTALCLAAAVPSAHAQDFFAQFFGRFGRQPLIRVPFNDGSGPYRRMRPQFEYAPRIERVRSSEGREQAFCVRTCDGRYFPVAGADNQSRATACNNFCPASETKLVYGSNIDNAETESGRPYSELPNAFRYRNELVAGCTCNGKDPAGLAKVKIEDDPTLRKGDIVAGENGLVVAGRSADGRGASLQFSPAPERIRAKYQRVPVLARE